MELVRYNVPSRQGAALANAILMDLKPYLCSNQSLPDLEYLFLDKSKIDRYVNRLSSLLNIILDIYVYDIIA